ncbi:hypothetical protein DFS34DRAFT_191316 [Phlyctochytrium arcticum]|nr:hypothetical protein DFS34DRAFT_191316 [Phlyctochytrium arcticum]
MIWDSSSLPSGPPAPPIVDGPRLIHKWSFVGVENDLEQQALTDDTAASFIDAGRNNRDEDSSNSASDDDDGPDLGEIASWERPSRRPSIAFKSKRKADHTASIDKSPRDSKAGQPPVLPIFNRLPPLREQLSNFLFPEADLPPLPRPLDPKPVMLERRRSHRRRTSDMSDYWSEFQLSKSQYFPTALEKVVADEHVPRIIYFFRTFSILAIMLATSGFYAAVSSIPIKAPYETAGSVKGSLYALAHVFLMSTGMGYYGAFALCTAIGLRATFTHFWRVHTPAIIYGVCCSAICWATIVQGSWPLPFQTFLYMFIFTPVVSTLVYISIPKVDRKPPGTIKLFCKRALVFCMMPMLFYICSALFMWAITVNLANPFRQVASLCAYRLCTILFVAACQHYANTVTKRRNPEVGSLMKVLIYKASRRFWPDVVSILSW